MTTLPQSSLPEEVLIVRFDIFDIRISELNKATRRLSCCTSCIGRRMAQSTSIQIKVLGSRVDYARCVDCGARTMNNACIHLGTTPEELEELAKTRQLKSCNNVGVAYRVKFVPNSI